MAAPTGSSPIILTATKPCSTVKDDKISSNLMRKLGDPSPWLGRSTYIRYMMIALECNEAQSGWIQAGKPKFSQ
jgi:hypothetical protein